MKFKIIKTLKQYNEYCDRHEKLATKNYTKHKDELELLELLIDDYDNRMSEKKYRDLNPVELLKILIKSSDKTQKEIAIDLGISKQLISDVLKYRRNISKKLVKKLATYFAMNEEAFSKSYALKNEDSLSQVAEGKTKYVAKKK